MQQPGLFLRAASPASRRETNHAMNCLIITPLMFFILLLYFYRGIIWVLGFIIFLVIIFATGYIITVLGQPQNFGRVSVSASFRDFGSFRATDPGLDDSTIEALPTFAYQREKDNVDSDSGDASTECGDCAGNGWAQCAICLGMLKIGEVVKQLPVCKHLFHVECIDKWLRLHSTCPMCRSPVMSAASEPPV